MDVTDGLLVEAAVCVLCGVEDTKLLLAIDLLSVHSLVETLGLG